jgi:hypothetical protein
MSDGVLASDLLQAHMRAHADLRSEVSVLNVEVKRLHDEIRELKNAQKELMQFMYGMQGGRAWLFGLLSIASGIGSILGGVVTYVLK